MSVLRCAGSLRVSFQDRFTEPSEGSTASHWLNWSLATPAGSSFTRSGRLQLTPLSVDRDRKMSVPLEEVSSIALFWTSCQATCRVPSGATNGSAPMTELGPLPVPLATTGVENVRPPPVDRLTKMTLLAEDLPLLLLALSQAT